MKKQILNLAMLFLPFITMAQNLTVEDCYEKARNNYPLIKQYGLIEKSSDYNISNANKAYLPQLNLTARATYQSDVTHLPISLPGLTIPELTKEQYQAVLEASQLIWDGGLISAQKKSIKATTETEKQKLEVDLHALNDRVNQIYFGILLINEQIILNEILQNELKVNLEKLNALKQNGLAAQSDLDAIRVEQLNAIQRETELRSTQKSFLQMLSALTGELITEKTELQKPIISTTELFNAENNRPELKLFEAQHMLFDSQKSSIFASSLPKLGLFVQGGIGKPGMNMLSNDVSPFYIGGVRLSWNISSLYTQKNNLSKIDINKKTVDIQKETFLFNNKLLTDQQKNDIERLKQILKNDDEIIELRNSIKKTAEVRVENGTLTVSDLIREINAENIAKQNKSLHEIQLYLSVYQLKHSINN